MKYAHPHINRGLKFIEAVQALYVYIHLLWSWWQETIKDLPVVPWGLHYVIIVFLTAYNPPEYVWFNCAGILPGGDFFYALITQHTE